jgi:hypothetical protein
LRKADRRDMYYAWERTEVHRLRWKKLKERDDSEDTGVYESIIQDRTKG